MSHIKNKRLKKRREKKGKYNFYLLFMNNHLNRDSNTALIETHTH